MSNNFEPEQVHNIAEELITVYTSSPNFCDSASPGSLERNDHEALERGSTHGNHNLKAERSKVHFGEFIYNAPEQQVYAPHIASEFSRDAFDIKHISSTFSFPMNFDWSHINFSNTNSFAKLTGFYLDIGTPRWVAGRCELNKILKAVNQRSIPLSTSENRFRFGDLVVRSPGLIELCLATPQNVPEIIMLLDIVSVNVTALHDLGVCDEE